VNVLGTIGWDLGRFGIQFVASPRHADGLLVTGAISATWSWRCKKLTPPCLHPSSSSPSAPARLPAAHSPAIRKSATEPAPSCRRICISRLPPHPLTILDGLLRLLGRLDDSGLLKNPPGGGTGPTESAISSEVL